MRRSRARRIRKRPRRSQRRTARRKRKRKSRTRLRASRRSRSFRRFSRSNNRDRFYEKGAPFEGAFLFCAFTKGLGGFRVDDLRALLADRDLARLLALRNFADEVDMQETVFEIRAADLDMVGELEFALESTRRDALIEHFAFLPFLFGFLLTADGELVFLHLDVEFLIGEARTGDRDAIRILAGALDIVGRITGYAAVMPERIEQRKDAVETDGRTVKGAEIETCHDISSI